MFWLRLLSSGQRCLFFAPFIPELKFLFSFYNSLLSFHLLVFKKIFCPTIFLWLALVWIRSILERRSPLGYILKVNPVGLCDWVEEVHNRKRSRGWPGGLLLDCLRMEKPELMVTRGGRVGERDRLGVWDWHVRTAICKIDNQQGPTVYSTGNSAQYSVIT